MDGLSLAFVSIQPPKSEYFEYIKALKWNSVKFLRVFYFIVNLTLTYI